MYEKECIYCLRVTKYIKGSGTRQRLNLLVELRADQTIRTIATDRRDERMLAVTARYLVPAEAHYHRSFYIKGSGTIENKRAGTATKHSLVQY